LKLQNKGTLFHAALRQGKCSQLSSSSNPFTPCGAWGIHEEIPGIAVLTYPLDLVP